MVLTTTSKPAFSIWLFVLGLLLATLYDHMIMYLGLFGHSVVVFHVFLCFFMFLCFTDCLCGCFFQWHFIDLFSFIAASLFNKLTYLLTIQANARHVIRAIWNVHRQLIRQFLLIDKCKQRQNVVHFSSEAAIAVMPECTWGRSLRV